MYMIIASLSNKHYQIKTKGFIPTRKKLKKHIFEYIDKTYLTQTFYKDFL